MLLGPMWSNPFSEVNFSVDKPHFLNSTVPVTRIVGCSFNTFHRQAPLGVYGAICEALVVKVSATQMFLTNSEKRKIALKKQFLLFPLCF